MNTSHDRLDTEFQSLKFEALTVHQLYQILKLRQDIFVLEQSCLYPDLDDKDFDSLHVIATGDSEEILGYCRLMPPGMRFEEAAIGRVCVSLYKRKAGMGYALMRYANDVAIKVFDTTCIRISAQSHLKLFYETLNYSVCSDPYEEDGIPHIEMIYRTKSR